MAQTLRIWLGMKQDDIRIAEPCKVDWKTMTPAEGGRFCGDCKKVVRNLSAMTEREAKKLLRKTNDGSLCVRYVYDAQGKIFFGADAPRPDVPVSSLLKRVAVAASLAVAACGGETELQPAPPENTKQEQSVDHQKQGDDDDVPPGYNEMMGGAPAMDPMPLPDSDAGSADGGAADAAPDGSVN